MSNADNNKPKPAFCPNCSKPALKTGNEIVCENCDAVFTITKTGAKVKSIGPIEDHEDRIAALEQKTGIIQEPAPAPEPTPAPEQDPEPEKVENDL